MKGISSNAFHGREEEDDMVLPADNYNGSIMDSASDGIAKVSYIYL